MKNYFQEDKYYVHENFLDVYLKVLVIFPNNSYYISWFNKNFKFNQFIDNDMVTIKSTENWREYAPK